MFGGSQFIAIAIFYALFTILLKPLWWMFWEREWVELQLFCFTADPNGWEYWVRSLLEAGVSGIPDSDESEEVDVFCTHTARLRCQLIPQQRDYKDRQAVWLSSGSGSDWKPNEVQRSTIFFFGPNWFVVAPGRFFNKFMCVCCCRSGVLLY